MQHVVSGLSRVWQQCWNTERERLNFAQACLDFLLRRRDIDHSKLFVYGQSLGGGVAVALAHANQDKIRGLIVENTFTSIDDMVLVLMSRLGYSRGQRFFRLFFACFLTNRWRNRRLISSIRVPTLFISGLADELVPPEHMRELHDRATACSYKQFLGVEGGEHNATYIQGGAQYFESFSAFISHLIS